jgi:hypothetical protein
MKKVVVVKKPAKNLSAGGKSRAAFMAMIAKNKKKK